jgi:FtsZ-binding cell division protein ZapB
MILEQPSEIVKYYIDIIKKNNTKIEELTEQNDKLKQEVKLLKWRLHEQD